MEKVKLHTENVQTTQKREGKRKKTKETKAEMTPSPQKTQIITWKT